MISGSLDQVYWDEATDTFFVIEAKGGSSKLGTRKLANGKVAEQGSRDYLIDILEAMQRKGGNVESAALKLKDALASNKVKYFSAKTPIRSSKGSPVLKDFVWTEFDITPGVN